MPSRRARSRSARLSALEMRNESVSSCMPPNVSNGYRKAIHPTLEETPTRLAGWLRRGELLAHVARDVADLHRRERRAESRHRVAPFAHGLEHDRGALQRLERRTAAVPAFALLAVAEHARGVVDGLAGGDVGGARRAR